MPKARKSVIRRPRNNRPVHRVIKGRAERLRSRKVLASVSSVRREPGVEAIGRFVPRGLAITVDTVLKVQGYADTSRVRPAVRAVAEAVTAVANRILTAEVRYRRIGILSISDGVLALDDGSQFHCRAFDRYLAGCREVVVFVLALGGSFERIARNFSVGNQMLEAILFEATGWMAVEQATKKFVRHLGECEGLKLTRRMAPGYSFPGSLEPDEWPLTEQAGLFALFAGVDLPLRLLESCAMTPKMSRSGLYGVRMPQQST